MLNKKLDIKDYKHYLPFIISIILFLIIIFSVLFLYIGWNGKITEEDKYSVEVNLPIVNWEKYSNLSKQYQNNIIDENNL